ncbi:5-guanidino-2-oxopentanoate decarboxylase [Nakamurella flavida]|uniref:5-guanidino-2-oxopentanoate decarboxylase n=1 Tax=Nakamurella flavida TaxID=363630 RepID=A0A939C2R5_9ACTN|nr:5-guanidino-2-oxopentanoate decarboxylase [Nakamurella flavida]MBM9476296.1 5-guanidino-2-oxopentanoate decarboxylase [Nakamurella flavida]MDP9779604.1 acetolactate synthase-1/2/3 large subunit [Nakamurella flavida]
MKFGGAILDLLHRTYDVDTVFGIPGVHTIELYRGVHDAALTSVVPRHEQGAGFMADGYARVTGRPGVCLLVSGPGMLNALTPIAQAWHDSVPMLVVAATTATADLKRGRGPLHDVGDQAAIAEQVTGISRTITDPDEFAQAMADAATLWATGRPRPVHLAVPVDLLSADTGPITPIAHETTPPAADPALVARAAGLLDGAVRPLILAGGGAGRAAAQLRALAERLDAPVITTGNAKGLLPEDHPLSIGTLLPFAPVLDLLADADVVLAVGTEFSEIDRLYTGAPLRIPGALIRVDIDPGQLDEPVPATIGLAADAATTLDALTQTVSTSPGRLGAERTATARAVTFTAQTQGHRPWLDAVRSSLTPDSLVVLDSTQLAYSALHVVPATSPGSWLAPYGLGTLGPALPMGIGARVGRPGAPVLAVAGDGGVLFTLPELATAVDVTASTGTGLTLLVWDNRGYAEIRDSFDRAGAPRVGTETSAHDLVAIAAGFGAHAERVDDPAALATALSAAAERPGVSVVVATDPTGPAG